MVPNSFRSSARKGPLILVNRYFLQVEDRHLLEVLVHDVQPDHLKQLLKERYIESLLQDLDRHGFRNSTLVFGNHLLHRFDFKDHH